MCVSVLKGVDDKAVEGGKSYSVIGFTEVGPAAKKTVYDPKADTTFPKGMGISPNRTVSWTDDLGALTFGIAPQKPAPEPKKEDAKKENPKEPEPKKDGPGPGRRRPTGGTAAGGKPDLVIWHWKDDRLQSQQQAKSGSTKTSPTSCLYRVKDKKFLRLADDESARCSSPRSTSSRSAGTSRRTSYMSTLDGKRFEDVTSPTWPPAERKKALTRVRWRVRRVAPTGRTSCTTTTATSTSTNRHAEHVNITEKAATSFVDAEDDHNIEKPPTRTCRLGRGRQVGARVRRVGHLEGRRQRLESAMNLTVNGKEEGIRYRGRVTVRFDGPKPGST